MADRKIDRTCSLDSALLELWQRTYMTLDRDELGWFAKLHEQAESDLARIADFLSDVACRVGAKGPGAIDHNELQQALFFGANVARNAAAMTFISTDAAYVREHFEECQRMARRQEGA